MVVLRLIGDQWSFDEKIAIAIPPQKSFNMCVTTLADKLGVEKWSGLVLYFTEGRPPNYVRYTVPLSLASNPQREKMKDGQLLYVRVGPSLAEQEADERFHESLMLWREQRGITAVRPDGSDVAEFRREFESRLNAAASRDIADFEAEGRARIEGDEHRRYWALTFEYREVQQLKADEAAARAELAAEARAAAFRLFGALVLGPRDAEARARLEQSAAERRAVVESTEGDDRDALQHAFRAALRASVSVPPAAAVTAGSAISAEQHRAMVAELDEAVRQAREDGARQLREVQHQLQAALLTAAAEWKRDAAEVRSLAVALVQDHARAVAVAARDTQSANDAVEAQRLALLDARLSATQDSVSNFARTADAFALANKDTRAAAAEALREQNELLARLIAECDEAAARQPTEQQLALSVVLDAARATQAALGQRVEQLRVVADEARAAAEHAVAATADLRREASESRAEAEASARRLRTCEAELHALQAAAVGGRRQSMLANAACADRVAIARGERLATLGFHPDAFDVVLQFVERVVPVELPADAPPAARGEFYRRHVADLVLLCGSPQAVADELCWQHGVAAHSQRRQFTRVLEEHAPWLVCVVDLALAIFSEREAELMAAIVPNGGKFAAYCDAGTGLTYYHHDGVGMSQWIKPVRFGE